MEEQEQEQQIDPVMEPARGDPNDSLITVRPGWWARNQGFIRRRAETLRRPAAQAEAEAERSREPASKKSMVELDEPAAEEVRDLDCAVCLEDLVTGGRKLRTMECSHSFHQRCIFRWLHVNRLCPMCRFAMPSRPDDEHVGEEVERELVAEEDAADEEKFAATEGRSSGE